MSKVICPGCGSKNLKSQKFSESDQLPLGPQFVYEKMNYFCNDCGEEGDFERVNDAKYLEVIKSVQVDSVRQIIDSLSEKDGISMAFFERALELPMRTLTRWKNGEFSATALALLRIIKTYPWILEIAVNKFNQEIAKQIVMREGVHLISNLVSAAKPSLTVSIAMNESYIHAQAFVSKNPTPVTTFTVN